MNQSTVAVEIAHLLSITILVKFYVRNNIECVQNEY